DDSLCRFFEYLLPWYSESPTYLRRQLMGRVASRIVRYAPEDVRKSLDNGATDDPTFLLTRALLALDQWIMWDAREKEDAPESEEETVYCRQGVYLVVLGAARDEEQVRRAIIRHRNHFRATSLRVVTPRVLRYWMRAWQPRQYYDWREYAELV